LPAAQLTRRGAFDRNWLGFPIRQGAARRERLPAQAAEPVFSTHNGPLAKGGLR